MTVRLDVKVGDVVASPCSKATGGIAGEAIRVDVGRVILNYTA